MTASTLRAASGYVFTNRLHVFLMPVLPTLFWNMALQLPLPPSYYLMTVLTTVAGYVFNIYTDHAEDEVNYASSYLVLGRGDRWTVPVILLAYLGSDLCALVAGWQFLLFNIAQHLLGCLYSMPIHFGGKRVRIKEVPFLKNLYAALFWSFALILTPFAYVGRPPTDLAWAVVLVCLGMSYFIELSWDLRDIEGDRQAGVRTVPMVMGVPFTGALLVAVHVATCVSGWWLAQAWHLAWPYALLFAVNLPGGLAWLAWYLRLPEKTLGSHLYVVWLGGLFAAGIALLVLA